MGHNQDAFLAIAIICQKGGTSKNAQQDIYVIVNKKKLLYAPGEIRLIMKETQSKFTLRQWARTYASQIHKVCLFQ